MRLTLFSVLTLFTISMFSTMVFSKESSYEIRSPERSKHFFELTPGDFNFKITGLNSGGKMPVFSADLSFKTAYMPDESKFRLADMGNVELKRHFSTAVLMTHFSTFTHFRYCNQIV